MIKSECKVIERVALLILVCSAGAALAAPESLRFDPDGFRSYDLAKQGSADAARKKAPEGLTLVIPGIEPGVDKQLWVPKKLIDDGIAQIVVESHADDLASTATTLLERRGTAYGAVCPNASTSIAGEREEFWFRAAASLTHCDKDPATGIGRVMFTKAIVGGERVHIVEIAYHYPAYEKGSTPLLESQISQAFDLLATAKVCYGKRDEDCRLTANRLMNAGPRLLSAKETVEVARIEALGRLLYDHDQLAWHGTDAVAERAFDLAGLQVSGWVTRIRGDEPKTLVFAGIRGGDPVGVVQVAYDQSVPTITNLNDAPLSGDLLAAFNARVLTQEQKVLRCTQARNSVVFSDPADGSLLVYWLSATEQERMMISGGHARFRVSADGARILERLEMTKSCLSMPLQGPKGETGSVVLTHLVTDMPTEIHVFNSIQHRVPVIVFAPGGTWRVSAGKLARIF